MSRLIFLFAIVALVYLLFNAYRKNTLPKKQAETDVEDMVCCVHCGVHLPVGESLRADDQPFCCAAHRDAYRQ
ncbi:MAG: PP0621 family protein [Gallionella sp.]